MKFAPRPSKESVPYVLALAFGLLGTLIITGVVHGKVAGLLFAVAMAGFGASVWWADGIAWRDIASWTVPLAGLIVVAWLALDSIPFIIAGLFAATWLGSFIFWLPPVRWWYRWVLRSDGPRRGG